MEFLSFFSLTRPPRLPLSLFSLPIPPNQKQNTVYAAGNYTTAQFIKFGIPLQLLQFATVTLIFILRPWKWILCGASLLLLLAVGVAIWALEGDSLAGLRRRRALRRAGRSGVFAGGEEKAAAVGSGNGAVPPKAA